MIKWTIPEHPDSLNLNTSLELMDRLCKEVNDKKRVDDEERSAVERMTEVCQRIDPPLRSQQVGTPQRKFIADSTVSIYDAKKRKPVNRHCFIFSDVIVLTKEAKAVVGSGQYKAVGTLTLQGHRINDVSGPKVIGKFEVPYLFELHYLENSVLFLFDTLDSKRAFLKHI